MKILILGSGQVGSTVAQNLASVPSNDVTIIDIDEKALNRISSRLDVQTIVGNGASPFTLEQAGAADSDLLLALTRSDETNIVASKIAADLFNIPSRIARVRSSEYLEYPVAGSDKPERQPQYLRHYRNHQPRTTGYRTTCRPAQLHQLIAGTQLCQRPSPHGDCSSPQRRFADRP